MHLSGQVTMWAATPYSLLTSSLASSIFRRRFAWMSSLYVRCIILSLKARDSFQAMRCSEI